LDRQRIDKWIWHARLVRTRSAAAALVDAGQVRVNGQRQSAASHLVRPGDVVTVALDRFVRVLKVTGFAERRGDSATVAVLYEDLQPLPPREQRPPEDPPAIAREAGSGRPTKRDRRMTDRLLDDD
jgi:ribosome-associated heat shock protein Hsp15